MKRFDSDTGYEIVGTVSDYRAKVRELALKPIAALKPVMASIQRVASTIMAAAPHLRWSPDTSKW